MRNIIVLSLIVLTGCGSIPTDGSPPWSSANRYNIEMINDCNTAGNSINNPSIGLSGCAFTSGQVAGNLRLPSLWTGRITGTSYSCKNIAVDANSTNDNVFQIADLYTATNKQSCSFEFDRSVKDGNFTSDAIMKGRFFIKIIPDSPYYSKLKFSIADEVFTGVGWYQKKTDTPEFSGNAPVLKVYPTGNKGLIKISCDGTLLQSVPFTAKPVDVTIDSNESCDLEIVVDNYDVSKVDLGTFIQEVNLRTLDITTPVVTRKSKKITFTFNDKDITGKTKVVYGVRIDGTKCIEKSACTVADVKDVYIVKGYTLSLRSFWGIWRTSTGKWSIK